MTQFANLAPYEHEILCCAAEEAAEIAQIVMMAMRHGIDSKHPQPYSELNRVEIAKEIGQLIAVADMMVQLGVLKQSEINFYRNRKWDKIGQYLHHIAIDSTNQKATALP